MISVVICSARADRLQAVRANIAATVGVEYELIAIDNSVEGRGLCEVYNRGAAQAKYEFICFVHEDVEFLSPAWGARALAHFASDTELGLIGLAGSRYKARTPSGWHCGDKSELCINIFHGATAETAEPARQMPASFASESCVPVVALDGVWLFARRAIWQLVRFDERLKGFHFYDVDFSLRVAQVAKVAVVCDIDLLHFSLGSFSLAWAEQALAYSARPPCELPFSLNHSGKEVLAVRYWLRLLKRAGLPLGLRLRWLAASGVHRYPSQWRLALRFLLG